MAHAINVLLACALLFGAFWILRYVARLVLQAGGLNLVSWVERWQVDRAIERARRADELIAEGRADLALDALRAAFHLTPVTDLALAGKIRNHHSGILSRVLAITAEYQGGSVRLLSLAKVDRLLTERRALQSTFIAARQGPDRGRLAQVAGQMASNQHELEGAIHQLISEIRQIQRTPVFH